MKNISIQSLNFLKHTAVATLFFLLVACQSSVQFDSAISDQIPSKAVESLAGSIKRVPLEENNRPLVQSAIKSKKIDVKANNENAVSFFSGLMAASGKNIIIHPELKGKITLNVRQMELDEILSLCREMYGYDYRDKNGNYLIFPRSLQSRIFKINYPDLKRAGISDTSILVGKIESTSEDSQSSSDGDSGLLGTLLGSETSGKTSSTTGTRVQTVTHSDFWHGLREAILSLIDINEKPDVGKAVFVSPSSGIIVVKAYPDELNQVRDLLESTQLISQRQVLLEAKIIEVELSKGFETGVNWEAISGQMHLLNNVSSVTDASIAIDENLGEAFASAISVNDIQELLNLLKSQGKVEVLSSPRISTINNQKAVIKVGSDEFFVTGISNTTTSNAATVATTPDVELTSFFSGIALDVTPQISDDNSVTLHIHPVVTDVADQQKDFIVGDDKFSLPLAFRDIRESDSIVRAKNGDVIVLGGLMKNFTRKYQQERQWMSWIPFLGPLLFKERADAKVKNELVILLKPQVIEDNNWNVPIRESRKAIQSIESSFNLSGKDSNKEEDVEESL